MTQRFHSFCLIETKIDTIINFFYLHKALLNRCESTNTQFLFYQYLRGYTYVEFSKNQFFFFFLKWETIMLEMMPRSDFPKKKKFSRSYEPQAVGPARSAPRSEMFTGSRYLLPTIPYSK